MTATVRSAARGPGRSAVGNSTGAAADGPALADAAALTTALFTALKQLRHAPLPVDTGLADSWATGTPAPRHVAALLHVVADERLSVSTLAERLSVSLATASQIVTDLEALQLVERVDDPADRRRTLVGVSRAHRDLTDALLETRLRPVQRALDRMRPAEQRAMIRGLQILGEEFARQNDRGTSST
jgi:DNA-binding MarR family transcriptional regulator